MSRDVGERRSLAGAAIPRIGSHGQRALISGQLSSVAALSRAGLNVVGDHIWVFRDWCDEALFQYAGLPVLWSR